MSYRVARQSRTVTISLPSELALEVDELAAAEHRTRSELLREAFRQYLNSRKRWEGLLAYGERQAGALGLTSEAAVADAIEARRRQRGRQH